jgi:hypothetical protein
MNTDQLAEALQFDAGDAMGYAAEVALNSRAASSLIPATAAHYARQAVSFLTALQDRTTDAVLREAQSELREVVDWEGGRNRPQYWLGALNVINRELYRRYLRGPKGLQVHLGQGVTQGVL